MSYAEEKPPLFELDERIFESMDIKDIEKTFFDMDELGLAGPPFSSFVIKANKNIIRSLYGEPPDCMRTKADTLESAYIWIKHSEADADGRIKFKSSVGVKFRGMELGWYSLSSGIDVDSARDVSFDIYMILIVLLGTKNAEKKTRVNTDRSPSPRARKDAKNFSTTTIIRIGKITETMRGSSSCAGTKTRPHLRRGHIRNQRYGQGLSETKKIFIAPMFVNADENWIAEQKSYKVTA